MNTNTTDTEKTFKIERFDDLQNIYGTNTKAWIVSGIIIYTSRGSSSCPPVIEKVKQTGNEIYLTTKTYTGICTADLNPVVQFIEYNDGTLIPEYVKVFLDGKQQN